MIAMMIPIWMSWRRKAALRYLGTHRLPEFLFGHLRRIKRGSDSSRQHHEDAVGLMKDFLHLVRDKNDGDAARSQSINNLINSYLGSDVNANRWRVED